MIRPRLMPSLSAAWLIAAALLAGSTTYAAEPPMTLRWDQLVPPAPPKPPKPFFQPKASSSLPNADAAQAQLPEARWMSSKTQTLDTPPEVVAGLDGKRVQIGGYVVALDFDATRITEFLLVPFPGACIHVPAPPPNQIIYVKAASGFSVKGQFDPVTVTGTLKTLSASTGLADTGYSLDAEAVEERTK